MYEDKTNRKNKRNIFSIAAAIGLTIIFAGVGVRIFGESEKEAEENNKSFFVSAELNKHMAGFEEETLGTKTGETRVTSSERKTEEAGNKAFTEKAEETEQGGFKDKAEQTKEESSKDKADKAGEEAFSEKTGEAGQENSTDKTKEEEQEVFDNKENEVNQEASSGQAEQITQENSAGQTEGIRQEDFEEKTELPNQTEPPASEISEPWSNQGFVSDTEYNFTDAPEGYFQDALFIGDSRTVDLKEYGNLEGADFFAVVGMSVYNITKQRVDVAGERNIDIETLLSNHSYGKIYFMLGLNELGYNRQKTVDRYRAWIEYIQQMQPQAIIFIEANLHVTAKKSADDEECRNQDIDEFNNYTKELADNRSIFYIDVNELFDDEGGSLHSDLTYDGVHVLAKYYKDWGEWLRKKAVVR